jgi:hypothetical protein
MPRRLLDRRQPDSIREFRAAARQRFDDALRLAAEGRRTGAVYLWGYTAEMTLKAAYFSLIGLAHTAALTWSDHIGPAVVRGRTDMRIAWPHAGQGHNVRAWAELLVAVRAATEGWHYPDPAFGIAVQGAGQRFEPLWSETLRYHKNMAYLYEVRQIREAAEWLLANSDAL